MNCTLARGATTLRHTISQLLIRKTCKIAVEVDERLLTQLDSEELKPRHHPGIIKTGRIQLSEQLSRTLERVIGDYPVKTLVQDCKLLNRYIQGRHPPTEQHELRDKIRAITDEVDQRMPPEKWATLSEAQQTKWRQKRERIVRRVVGNRVYSWKPILYGKYEALVYAIGRGPQEYAVLMHILRELNTRDPQFKPKSFFDFGSGVGTGMWAASSLWKNSIFEYFNVDSSREMHDLAELILCEGKDNQQMSLRNVYFRQFLPNLETKYDLVISSFSLFELPNAESRQEVILNLWRKCDGYLIIAEEGTRRGTELVNEAREFVLGLEEADLKGHVFAPCPHDSPCPRLNDSNDNTPCNFEVAFEPLKLSDIKSNRQTARYSYVILAKGSSQDDTRQWPRLVRPTLVRSKHAICRMCTAEGKLQEIIFTQSKHGRPAYRCAKASRWGDRLPITVGEPFKTETRRSAKKKKQEAEVETTETEKP